MHQVWPFHAYLHVNTLFDRVSSIRSRSRQWSHPVALKSALSPFAKHLSLKIATTSPSWCNPYPSHSEGSQCYI
ncbi:hypothetical protein NXS19_013878 [Fusarium pseudograminearum]|nr:hypothetical protein NXS19_013878 [Fusarium pseudograminearum]